MKNLIYLLLFLCFFPVGAEEIRLGVLNTVGDETETDFFRETISYLKESLHKRLTKA